MKHIQLVLLALAAYLTTISCGVSYKFNNAKLDYNIYKTISIGDFPNQAPLVYPSLYQQFNEAIKDAFSRQTRLQNVQQNGDYDIQGAITGYYLQQMSVGADALAAETKLTMTVRVAFTNNKNSTEDFEKSFSAFRTFPSTTQFESVQSELVTELITEIIDQIFNSTVANW